MEKFQKDIRNTMIIFQKFIHREDLKNNPDCIYLFGDNDMRIGNGGQAKEMRGEKNVKGIRVKKSPGTKSDNYYTDKEYEKNIKKIDDDFAYIECMLQRKYIVIIPSDGIGTGLAKLKEFAPETLLYIQHKILTLWETYI